MLVLSIVQSNLSKLVSLTKAHVASIFVVVLFGRRTLNAVNLSLT